MFDDEDKEEDVSIDFSKIRNIFKRKKGKEEAKEKAEVREEPRKEEKAAAAREEAEEGKDDDEISIDFGKVKNLFKWKEGKKAEKAALVRDEVKESKEDDEEISIDFSKVKNFFKGKKEENAEKGTEKPSEGNEDEIAVDFSKIKNIFKKGKRAEGKEEGAEEEISFDLKKTIGYLNQRKNILIPLALLLIAVYFSVSLRLMPAYLPITDDWARGSVYNYFRDQIRGQIDQQYPNLPDANKDPLVDAEFKKLLKVQKQAVEQQVKATSDYFKSRLQDDKGQTYLLEIDPYYWMRYVKNIIENGYPGDEIKDEINSYWGEVLYNVQWDNHMFAPDGKLLSTDMFHAYFEAYLFKFLRFFNRDLDLMKVIFYVPVLVSALAVIPAFFIARRMGGNFGGAIAAIIVAIHPSMLTRTAGGFADTDAYNILFPLLITWLFLEAFETRNMKKGLIFSSIAGFLVGVYSITWGGWWYILDFILAASLLCAVYYTIIYRKEFSKGIVNFIKHPAIRNTFSVIGIFVISSGLFVSLFTDFSNFYVAPLSPLTFVTLKQVAITDVWPNVFTTVAEQNPSSLDDVIAQIGLGNWLLFLIALAGVALTMTGEKKKRGDLLFIAGSVAWFSILLLIKPRPDLIIFLILVSLPIVFKLVLAIRENNTQLDVKVAILLMLWLTATVYATTKGVRFGLLLVPAFSVAFGVALGALYKYSSRSIEEGLRINKTAARIVIIILLSLLLAGPYKSAIATARSEIPLMDDAWYNSLEKIRLESEPNAIINSWWDFGHWFKMIGDRAVTFDGTSQSSPQAHWIGNALMTDDEDIAVGILRMLDCSGYEGGSRAFDKIDEIIKNVPKSISITYEIMAVGKKEAGLILAGHGLDKKEIDSVLGYSHCEAPENYFITSEDMVGKSGVWSHFGSWDFNRAVIYNTLKKEEYMDNLELGIKFLEDMFNYSRNDAEGLYYEVQGLAPDDANSWIAPWPSYMGGPTGCRKDGDMLLCPFVQGSVVEINLSTMDANIPTSQGIMHPDSLVYATKDGVEQKKFRNNTVGISLTIIPEGDSYNSIISSPQLAASMFTRMFYMEGHGLSHFKKFSDERSVTGSRVIVWKVDWEGKEKNIEYFKAPEIEEGNSSKLNKTVEESETLANES